MLAGPAVLPVLPFAKFDFDILVIWKDPYCILLASVMPVDAAQKKDDEILGLLFQKVLPAGHNAGQVIIKPGLHLNANGMRKQSHRSM